MANDFRADHVFRHHPNAIEAFPLVAFLAYNLFHALFALNLKPRIRRGKPRIFWVRLISARLYADPGVCPLDSS